MEDGQKITEYCKYTFSEDEKKEIAGEMARKIADRDREEAEKKAAASDFKSRIDRINAEISEAATKLNNGYEFRNIECIIHADYEAGLWVSIRDDNGEIGKERKMSPDDKQRKLA